MTAGAVLVAAGTGERLGGRGPKALVEVAGIPLVFHALHRLRESGLTTVAVVHTPGHEAAFQSACGDSSGVHLVPGGATRTDSVRAGLAALPAEVTLVAIHDAARPFVPPAVVRAAVDAVRGDVIAAAPALPVADTLKRVRDGEVVATLDRAQLVAVQTPQVFPRPVLEQALVAGTASDDLALVERLRDARAVAGRIVTVPGSPLAMKITFPQDLAVAAALAAGSGGGTVTGSGAAP